MPEKWKPDEKIFTRGSTKIIIKKNYLKGTPTAELVAYIKNENSKPKKIHKAWKELRRRNGTKSIFWGN